MPTDAAGVRAVEVVDEIHRDHALDDIRSDPRFQALVRPR